MTLMNFLEGLKTMLDKLMAAFKPKQAAPETKPADAPATPADAQKPEPAKVEPKQVDPAAVAEMATKLEAYVYDPEVAQELAPMFVAMSSVEGFDKLVELLDAKEKQIEAIQGNTPQQSTPAVKKETVVKTPTAADILKARNQSK
jgi:hypothetical protein